MIPIYYLIETNNNVRQKNQNLTGLDQVDFSKLLKIEIQEPHRP